LNTYRNRARQLLQHLGLPSMRVIGVSAILEAAPKVLAALERLIADTEHLCGAKLSLADIRLAPEHWLTYLWKRP
jgi:glutathione S-transferase